MEKFIITSKKLLGTLFALLLVSSIVLGSAASASNNTTTIKSMEVNTYKGKASITRGSRDASWSTSFVDSAVKCKVSGTYSYRSTSSGSLTSGVKVEKVSGTAAASTTRLLSSGLVFESITGKHTATNSGVTVTKNTSNP